MGPSLYHLPQLVCSSSKKGDTHHFNHNSKQSQSQCNDIALPSIYLMDINKDKKKNKKKKTLEELIDRLPQDVQNYIYRDFLEPDIYLEEIKKTLKREESMSLNICYLRPYIPILLAKKKVMEYLCKQLECFNITYKNHKINDGKTFVKMQKGNSFAQEILMYLYH